MNSKDLLNVSIITSTEIIFEGKVKSLLIPDKDYTLSIYPGHSDLYSIIDVGIIKLRKQKNKDFFCFGGIMKIKNNNVKILANEAKKPTEKVLKEIQTAIKKAESKTISENILPADLIRAERELKYYILKRN